MKLKHIVTFGLVAAFAVAVTAACVSKKRFTKEFSISSNPPGAQVLVDGAPVGNTPTNVRMEFELNLDYPDQGLIRHEVTVKKEGYLTETKSVYHNDPPRVHFEMEKKEKEKKIPAPAPPPRQP